VRGPLAWIVAITAGVLLVIVVTAVIGSSDRSGETVPAGDWAQDVCGAVGVWRGEKEAIAESIRTSQGSSTGTESGAATPEGRVGAARIALERGILATETLVEAIERAGTPDTAGGVEAAETIEAWAGESLDELEQAEEALDEEPETLEEALERVSATSGTIASVVAGGILALGEVANADPELASALQESSTCQQLTEETS
jgi:hypothetical protein